MDLPVRIILHLSWKKNLYHRREPTAWNSEGSSDCAAGGKSKWMRYAKNDK